MCEGIEGSLGTGVTGESDLAGFAWGVSEAEESGTVFNDSTSE